MTLYGDWDHQIHPHPPKGQATPPSLSSEALSLRMVMDVVSTRGHRVSTRGNQM